MPVARLVPDAHGLGEPLVRGVAEDEDRPAGAPLDRPALRAPAGARGVAVRLRLPLRGQEDVVAILPSLNAPTIANLYNTNWMSVETVVEESQVRELIPRLIQRGAEGIIEYPLNKLI